MQHHAHLLDVELNGSVADAPEALTVHNIKSTKIVFLPAPNLKRSLEHLSFEISKDPVIDDDNDDEDDGNDGSDNGGDNGEDEHNPPSAGE
ncbi:MAG: hypothetical protein LBD28_01180 [Tannerellaceae bacterium]|nr:hypothetical protein [Tannerellaceae bacterium]